MTAQPVVEPEAPTQQQKFVVEAWVSGKEGAVKILVMTTVEPTLNHLAELKARAVAQYRVEFGEWATDSPGTKVTPR
jgi:hypothetical protein